MKGDWIIKFLIFGFSVVAIFFSLLVSFLYVGEESTFTLAIFNFLFFSLTIMLKGALLRKISMLLIGNVIGLFWNYLFSSLAHTGTHYFGIFFNTLYMILNPFISLIWIVSFWSVSLSILSNSEKREAGELKLDS